MKKMNREREEEKKREIILKVCTYIIMIIQTIIKQKKQ